MVAETVVETMNIPWQSAALSSYLRAKEAFKLVIIA